MKPIIAETKNLSKLKKAYDSLCEEPGLGVIYGDSGLGKTAAVKWLVGQSNGQCTYVVAEPTWSPLVMCQKILRRLGDPTPPGRLDRCKDLIQHKLESQRQTLLIDECNELLEHKKSLRILKSIYDFASTPILLFGEPGFHQYIEYQPKFRNRVHERIRFFSLDLEDARLIADACCEVGVGDALLESLHKEIEGNTKRLCQGLRRIEKKAKSLRIDEIDQNQWGQRLFFPELKQVA